MITSRRIMEGELKAEGQPVVTLVVTVDHAGYHLEAIEISSRKGESWASVKGLLSAREAKTAGWAMADSYIRAHNLHQWGITWREI